MASGVLMNRREVLRGLLALPLAPLLGLVGEEPWKPKPSPLYAPIWDDSKAHHAEVICKSWRTWQFHEQGSGFRKGTYRQRDLPEMFPHLWNREF